MVTPRTVGLILIMMIDHLGEIMTMMVVMLIMMMVEGGDYQTEPVKLRLDKAELS